VWHPVGALPARVYWRRRLLVLVVLLAVLGGGIWLGIALLTGGDDNQAAPFSGTSARVPALDRVTPSLAAVTTPTPDEAPASTDASSPAPAPAPTPTPTPAPAAGGPCTDDMLGLAVRAPGSVAVGDKPTLELVVSNVSAVPCVRTLDKGLQEIVLLDGAGTRLWGSNDCFREASSDVRTLAAGESVALPLVWGGRTSEPTCAAPRATPPPGSYLLRGRLDTKQSPDVPLTLR
jgi:hypothetical protein